MGDTRAEHTASDGITAIGRPNDHRCIQKVSRNTRDFVLSTSLTTNGDLFKTRSGRLNCECC